MSDVDKIAPPPADNGRSKKSHSKQYIYIIAVLLIVGLVFLILYRRHASAAKAAAATRSANQPVPVIVGKVQEKDVPIYLDGLGTVQAFNTVTVHSRVDGELIKVAFNEGQDVNAGDILAQIDPAPYQAALDQATAKKAQDEAQVANAKVDLKRYSDLLASAGTTQQVYDTQKALVDQLAAAVQADEAAIQSAKVNLDYATIRSPIDARVGIRLVDQGNIVHASDAGGLVVLTQLRPISVVFTLPETAFPKLQRYQSESNYTVLALARDNTNVLATGELAVIDNQIDSTTGTIKLKATFANKRLRLWPGEFVNTRLLLTVRTNSAVVPASVVQRGPDGEFAFVVQKHSAEDSTDSTNSTQSAGSNNLTNATVKIRSLQVFQIDNGEALIDQGLEPGEVVVVDGQYKLQDGSPIKVTPPADSSGSSTNSAHAHKHQSQ
jgi:multidrug efflux system membrane fusion protein